MAMVLSIVWWPWTLPAGSLSLLLMPAQEPSCDKTHKSAFQMIGSFNLKGEKDKKMRILVVEDDQDLNRQICRALESNGFVADHALDGEEGQFLGETEPYDAIILDMGLPVINGLTVLKAWREQAIKTPVLVLTARDSWSDKVEAIDTGADDYVTKPFHMEEILARLRALIRRASGHASNLLTHGPVSLNLSSQTVRWMDRRSI
jgi:DNA-binding response OmpR family regulator